MAWTPPRAGEFNAVLRFERRGAASNIGGVVKAGWETLVERRQGRLLPLRGGEETQADRLSGLAAYELVIRMDSEVDQVTTDDRAVDVNNPSDVYGIRWRGDLEGKRRWLVMTLQQGTDDGRQGT